MVNLLGCPFCGGNPTLINGGPGNCYVRCTKCKASSNDVSRDRATELWNTRALSTPNAPVEPTPAQVNSACLSYRHDFGLLSVEQKNAARFMAREWLHAWQKEGVEILAGHLDEAAIRKDEREKCAAIADDHTPRKHDGTLAAHVTGSRIASAIRNGGKQP